MDKELFELKKDIIIMKDMITDIFNTFPPKRMCPICKNEIGIFLPYGVKLRSGALCPNCKSLERHRGQWMWLEKNKTDFFNRSMCMLHFAPEPPFYTIFSKKENIDYWPVDFNPDFNGIRKQIDITSIDFCNEMFDVILCNHVLEHIIDDRKAMSELYRVLKCNGIAIISVPWNPIMEKTFENPEYNTPELRLKYFHQKDHVRNYGNDIITRLTNAGFTVNTINPTKDMSNDKINQYGLNINDSFFICTK